MKTLKLTLAAATLILSAGLTQGAMAETRDGGIGEYTKTSMAYKESTASSDVMFKEMNNDEGISAYKTSAMQKVQSIKPAAGMVKKTWEYNSDLND